MSGASMWLEAKAGEVSAAASTADTQRCRIVIFLFIREFPFVPLVFGVLVFHGARRREVVVARRAAAVGCTRSLSRTKGARSRLVPTWPRSPLRESRGGRPLSLPPAPFPFEAGLPRFCRVAPGRSEERRVGEEGRSRGSPD